MTTTTTAAPASRGETETEVTAKRPGHPDGFNGAGDASRLAAYADEDTAESGICHVQATAATREMLHRAGYKRVTMMHSYPVNVYWEGKYGRWQLAETPVVKAQARGVRALSQAVALVLSQGGMES